MSPMSRKASQSLLGGGVAYANALHAAPPKVTGKRQREPSKKPISNIDIEAILAEGMLSRKKQITQDNSIPAFKQALRLLSMESDEEKHFVTAVDDMKKVIHSLIRTSMGDQHYDRALENIGVMREQLIGLEVPGLYNDFLQDLKTRLKSGALGDDRRDFWFKMRYPGKLGLIHKGQSEYSDITEDDAHKVNFLLGISPSPSANIVVASSWTDRASCANVHSTCNAVANSFNEAYFGPDPGPHAKHAGPVNLARTVLLVQTACADEHTTCSYEGQYVSLHT